MDNRAPFTIDQLTARDIFADSTHSDSVPHEILRNRLQELQLSVISNIEQADILIDQLIDRHWLMPLTIWHCPPADAWPSPMTVYRRGPACPAATLPPPVKA